MRLHLELNWQLQQGDEVLAIPSGLFKLLDEIALGKNLRGAAESAGISYRNAWGQIELWEKHLNNKLVHRERGKGTRLSAFAAALIEAKINTESGLRNPLDNAAETASGHLTRMLASEDSALRIVTSHHELINQFANKLRDSSRRRISFDVIGSEAALRRYQRADADICGFHIPTGAPFVALAEHLLGWLDERRDQIFFLENRALGLISNPSRPVTNLQQLLSEQKLRFINRQAGSTTRLVFDSLLTSEATPVTSILGYEDEEHTHTAVAALIASGDRDVGFGEANAAQKFNLAFAPLVQERFYIALKRELQSAVKDEVAAFFEEVGHTSYEPTSIGEILAKCQ